MPAQPNKVSNGAVALFLLALLAVFWGVVEYADHEKKADLTPAEAAQALEKVAEERPAHGTDHPRLGASLKVEYRTMSMQTLSHLKLVYLAEHLDEDIASGQAFHLEAGERVRVLKNAPVVSGYRQQGQQGNVETTYYSQVQSLDRPLQPRTWVLSQYLIP
jgi:hypothetical protein